MRSADNHLTEWIGYERSAPESQIAFASHAIHCSGENPIQRSVGAHGVLPTPRGERLVAPQLFKPADGRGIENDLRPLNRIHASRFRIPLVIADKRSNDGLAGVHLHIAEIARRKLVLLIIVGIMRNMYLPVFA